MVTDASPLTIVLPIAGAADEEGLLETLKFYGHCVTFHDALENPKRQKRIVVGKVILEYDTYRDSRQKNYGKVYHLESIVPGDPSRFRFVACGKKLVNLVADNFEVTVGDFLALYEPCVMRSAADLTTFYFPPAKCTLWVCKAF